jgi:hypothetical protein
MGRDEMMSGAPISIVGRIGFLSYALFVMSNVVSSADKTAINNSIDRKLVICHIGPHDSEVLATYATHMIVAVIAVAAMTVIMVTKELPYSLPL